MNVIESFLENPASRWRKFRLWLWVTWLDVRDWFARWIFAQHNARVIIDFESRMVAVIYEATGGMMSKPYYTEEAMLQLIREHHSKLYDEGYDDAKSDFGPKASPNPISQEGRANDGCRPQNSCSCGNGAD